MKRILIVEDDPAVLRGLEAAILGEEYEVLVATDGERCHEIVKEEQLDLIILDIMLPKKHGFDVCRDLRREGIHTPILILSTKKEEIDQILGINFGSYDYMTKPFSVQELYARIKSLLRKSTKSKSITDDYYFGNIHIDFKKKEITKDIQGVQLSEKEFKVLEYLIQHEEEIVLSESILHDIWGFESFCTTTIVDNCIRSLIHKLEADCNKPRYIIKNCAGSYKFIKQTE